MLVSPTETTSQSSSSSLATESRTLIKASRLVWLEPLRLHLSAVAVAHTGAPVPSNAHSEGQATPEPDGLGLLGQVSRIILSTRLTNAKVKIQRIVLA